jgi:1-deoxy-D-xylulose-5-phosphate reductoisomerase
LTSPKKIAILGSTGSIGVNTLNVVRELKEDFQISALSTNINVDLLFQQAKEFKPDFVAISHTGVKEADISRFKDLGIHVFTFKDCLVDIVKEADYGLLVNSVVGAAGFLPTLRAVQRGKDVALANKESLVVGGELITKAAQQNKCSILPIDSEHSAIFQSLVGEDYATIEQVILTASGGPFRSLEENEFENITVEKALNHPNWKMGNKITIDSATMMNKGLEIIEAHWLFDVPFDKIKVVVHPESIIHSMVLFVDGSIKAQLGLPDMRVPIQYAITYPNRKPSSFQRLDFENVLQFNFERPNFKKFPSMSLAYQAGNTGGTAPAILNAANEMAVAFFLKKRIKFTQIPELVEAALNELSIILKPTAEELIKADFDTRQFASTFCENI